MTTSTPAPADTVLDLTTIRGHFLDRAWVGLLFVTSLSVPLSLARTFFTGWQPAYAVQFIMLAVLGGGFIFRHRLGFRVRALLMVAALDFNGIVSVSSFGMFGASWWWLFMSSLLVAMFFHTRAGVLHALCAMLLLIVVGLAFVQGSLMLDFDANAYSRQLLPWAGMLMGPVLYTFFVFRAFEGFLNAIALHGKVI